MTDTEKAALCARIDELCAEVERLHGEIRLNPLECALSEAQAFRGQVAGLQAENAKLRELVRMMWKPFLSRVIFLIRRSFRRPL